MTIFFAKALSSNAIGLKWLEPNPPNGILKPYVVKCYNVDGVVSWSTNALTNTTTSALILGLQPYYEYTCQLKASTIPHKGQSIIDCTTIIEISPLRTLKTSE